QSSGWLLPERAIRIGPYQVRLTEGLSPERAAHATSHLAVDAFDPQIDTLPQVSLEFLEDTSLLQVWRMNRKLALIGRLPECRVRLRDASVSSFHACLVLTPSGLWVVDLLHVPPTAAHTFPVSAFPPSGSISLPDLPGLAALAAAQAGMPATSGSTPEPSKFTEAVLLHLVQQFGSMQQQMFSQFQQTVVTLAEVFKEIQADQIHLIRQELEQLNRLTQELSTVQAEVIKHSAGAGAQAGRA